MNYSVPTREQQVQRYIIRCFRSKRQLHAKKKSVLTTFNLDARPTIIVRTIINDRLERDN